MKANANVSTIATTIANTLWASYEASVTLSEQIVTLLKATSRDLAQAGEAIGLAWNEIGGEIEGGLPTRLLVEACANTKLTKEETRALIKATGLVSKQRAHVLASAVYDGVSNAKAGAHGKGKGKGEKVNTLLTIDQIVAAIEAHASVSKSDAARIALALQAKLA